MNCSNPICYMTDKLVSGLFFSFFLFTLAGVNGAVRPGEASIGFIRKTNLE